MNSKLPPTKRKAMTTKGLKTTAAPFVGQAMIATERYARYDPSKALPALLACPTVASARKRGPIAAHVRKKSLRGITGS